MKFVVAVAVALLVVPAAAAKPAKPKPWQWTTTKTQIRLTAARPIVGGDIGDKILETRCVGKGKQVAARFSKFLCAAKWGSTNGAYTSNLVVRILAVGSGKLCVITAADGRAIPAPGPMIKPERACP